MRVKKQSMRQLTDAAALDRAAGVLLDLVAESVKRSIERNDVPGNDGKPQYFRGALVRSRKRHNQR